MPQPNSVTLTAIAAKKAGMSYGLYVAKYGVVHENGSNPLDQAERKVCPVCGMEFVAQKKSAVYCSLECKRRRYNMDRMDQYRENRKKGFDRNRVCAICGKPFAAKQRNQRYCGHECYDVANKEFQRIARQRRKEESYGQERLSGSPESDHAGSVQRR